MDIEQLEQRKTELLARRNELITAINELKYTTPELSTEENDELEEQSLRSGAEAYMKYDPDTGYKWLQQAEALKARKEGRSIPVYTPEQKSIIDAKQQNRIRMGEIQSTINSMTTETERKPWIQQLEALQANDIELNNKLADLGTSGYKSLSTTATKAPPGGSETGEELVTIAPNKNSKIWKIFANPYFETAKSIKSEGDVPTWQTIQSDASDAGYDISDDNAKGIRESMLGIVQPKIREANEAEVKKRDAAERARQARVQAFSQHKDFLASVQTVKAIQADPINQTNIQLGISELLKILSGTGVSDIERMNTVLSLTPTDYQNKVRSQARQLGKAFVDKFLKMDNVVLAEYATHVNPQLIAGELKKRIPSESWKWAEANSTGSGTDGKTGKGNIYGL